MKIFLFLIVFFPHALAEMKNNGYFREVVVCIQFQKNGTALSNQQVGARLMIEGDTYSREKVGANYEKKNEKQVSDHFIYTKLRKDGYRCFESLFLEDSFHVSTSKVRTLQGFVKTSNSEEFHPAEVFLHETYQAPGYLRLQGTVDLASPQRPAKEIRVLVPEDTVPFLNNEKRLADQ